MTRKARRSIYVAMVASLAALHIILSYAPPLVGFRRISIVMEPLEGIIAGPYFGFLAAAVGWIGGRVIRPDSVWIENLFGIAEAVGALGAGFLFSRRWYVTAGIYGLLFLGFFAHPLARQIPLWTLWDNYLGLAAVFAGAYFVGKLHSSGSTASWLLPTIILVSFAAVELDAMMRVFMLVVGGLYQLFPIPVELLPKIFVLGAFQTPIEAAYSVAAATIVGVPLFLALEKSGILTSPLS